MDLEIAWVGGNIKKLYMIQAKIFGIILCSFGIIKALLNIVWLYKPNFLKDNKIYKLKNLSKFEQVTYYLAGILCMYHYIHAAYLKLLSIW